jgi:predicted NBD/HSP70 family sugar kinase
VLSPSSVAQPSNQQTVRRNNLSVVLRQVVERGPRSRATIAHETGLNKSTVSSLVGELIEFGLLAERGAEQRVTAGRPGLVVDIARDGVVALGLELNVDYLGVQATDLAGGSRYKAMEAGDNRGRSVDDVFDRLGTLARGALVEMQSQGLRTIGATLALPGVVDVMRGEVRVAPNLRWHKVPAINLLRERIDAPDLPLTADNEANLAALAELWEGEGTGLRDFVYASGEIGVGGGIVLGGDLFRGFRGFGGELGHAAVEPEGRRCVCGSRGCLETRAGLEVVLENAGLGGAVVRRRGVGQAVAELVERAREGDETALSALTDCGHWLGVALSTVVNLICPQAIILGGHFAPIATWLAPAIERELGDRVVAGEDAVPPVLRSRLGPEAAMRGGAAAQLHRVLADPTVVAAANFA